jgi:hypothetical protein
LKNYFGKQPGSSGTLIFLRPRSFGIFSRFIAGRNVLTFVASTTTAAGRFEMPVVVAVHRLKNFDEWFKVFQSNPPPKVGRWRVMRGSEDRNRVHVVAEMTASEVKDVKDFIQSKHMQDVFKKVNDMSTAPIEIIWLEEVGK